jgi:hypothetical protein
MMLTLLKHFTFAATNGGSFTTDWFRVPEGNQNWQLVFEVHSHISTTVATGQLQTTWDTSTQSNIGSSANLATNGLNPQDITTGMGPMVRLVLTAGGGGATDSAVTLSVFLTPKSN